MPPHVGAQGRVVQDVEALEERRRVDARADALLQDLRDVARLAGLRRVRVEVRRVFGVLALGPQAVDDPLRGDEVEPLAAAPMSEEHEGPQRVADAALPVDDHRDLRKKKKVARSAYPSKRLGCVGG